jgi:hypothetical protein
MCSAPGRRAVHDRVDAYALRKGSKDDTVCAGGKPMLRAWDDHTLSPARALLASEEGQSRMFTDGVGGAHQRSGGTSNAATVALRDFLGQIRCPSH